MSIALLITLTIIAFFAGVGCTLAAGMIIEQRVLARPHARVTIAARLLHEQLQDGAR